MGISLHHAGLQAHRVKKLFNNLFAFSFTIIGVGLDRFDALVPDPVDRVKGVHCALGDQADSLPENFFPEIFLWHGKNVLSFKFHFVSRYMSAFGNQTN